MVFNVFRFIVFQFAMDAKTKIAQGRCISKIQEGRHSAERLKARSQNGLRGYSNGTPHMKGYSSWERHATHTAYNFQANEL